MANERVVTVQGIDVPASSIGTRETDQLYYGLTRRQTRQAKPLTSISGFGNSDEFQLIHDGIVAGLIIRVLGTITLTAGTGSIATSRRWPHDILRGVRFSANGQTNLVNVSGAKLKALQCMYPDSQDRGVQPRGGVSATPVAVGITGASPGFSVPIPTALYANGTMAMAQDVWGVGSGVTAIAGAPSTYPVDLRFFVPVAYDQKTLEGAIFAQTEGTNLVLALDWANQADLFNLGGNASVAQALSYGVHEVYFDIPIVGGKRLLPSGIQYFHQLVQTRATTAIAAGDNEFLLPGVARGRKLMRVMYQFWNGVGAAATGLPAQICPKGANGLTVADANAENFGSQGWIYGGNQNPERYNQGSDLAEANERIFNSNLAIQQGFLVHDFANEWAFRDLVDLGSTNDIRLLANLSSNVTLASPTWEVVQQVLVGGPTPQA